MAKAQWKEPPVSRKFGVRSELQHIQAMERRIAELEEKNKLLKYKYDTVKNGYQNSRKENEKLQTYRLRYKWLRAAGVVVTDEGEFKHLKGDDMDKFFESVPQPLFDGTLFAHSLANSMRATKEALAQSMLTGTSIYRMVMDEPMETENGSNA